jgi:membrane protein YqaA with SNARE-associated domain
MHFSDLLTGVFCLVLAIGLLSIGSAAWLAIRGRPVTPANVGNMIGGIVKWMIADFLIDMIFSAVFNSNRRRRW